MPNYRYKCIECEYEEMIPMRMSADPSAQFPCPKCSDIMTRRIGKPQFTVERETLGKWFKEQTGKELLGD